ncbi:hypothetical protein Pcac1_g20303 [Phytophthora cactorum]|nr:hypothetical protein Pcac1_g20303 [Phytophthora cactorum]
MEDKGMVLLRAFSTISPTSPRAWFLFMQELQTIRNRDDGMWASIHAQLPPVSSRQAVLLLDIQCATGNDACAVLHHLVHEMQISAKSIYFVTVISSFEVFKLCFGTFQVSPELCLYCATKLVLGLKHHLFRTDVTLIVAQVDTELDADQRIRPGIWRLHAAVLECPLRPQRAVKSSKVQSMQTTLLRTADLKYICDLFLV